MSEFDYHLPSSLIAAYPTEDRASARLLHVPKQSGDFSHHVFRDITQFLKAGDVLVLNNTKVLPARLFGKKETGGKVEALLLKEISGNTWETLLKPGGRIREGMTLEFGANGKRLRAEVIEAARPNSGQRCIRFLDPNWRETLEQIGHIPLPPYIDREDTEIDRTMYQTVFAAEEGAVASPTAGLHFDEALLEQIEKLGVQIVKVTLHVSYGTFQPIAVEDLTKHDMFEEEYEIKAEAADKINQALKEKRRVIACGTTSVRALESAATKIGELAPKREKTKLFIYPPYDFKVVSGMITNFHLPKSSLLCLVSALIGREKLFQAYEQAIQERYRFYSYGDAMLIL